VRGVRVSLRTVDRTGVGGLSALIAEAFDSLDVVRWLVEDPAARAQVLPGYFALLTEHAVRHGTVRTASLPDEDDREGDCDAVSVWLTLPGEAVRSYEVRLHDVCGPWTSRFRRLDQAMERLHPARTPHAYLAFLAVRPACQGRGLGTSLLRRHHEDLDREGLPSYLEAADPRSARLYSRHGYVPCGPPLPLPVRGESLRPMWREPRGPQAA
jgi:GNAT superfamily N-acetyltransferase